MSRLLSSPDLSRLVSEGYELEIRSGHLLVQHVPYVTSAGEVAYGALACELSTAGEQTAAPATHVMFFVGGIPCDRSGTKLIRLIHSDTPQHLGGGITAACSFSQKPPSGRYSDYYAKVSAYANLIVGHAQALDPTATAQTYKPIVTDEQTSVFRYIDCAASRSGIGAYNDRLALPRVAIIGLGGTGSYVLDLIAKVPIQELHLFDADVFATHNAFRAPGAATLEQLNERPLKVTYFAQQYAPLRRGIVPHPVMVTAANVGELDGMDFVFLCIDASPDKKVIIERLEECDVPFIDTGIGVRASPEGIGGIVRATASFPGRRDHVRDDHLISYVNTDEDDDYDQNIQVAELNCLAAVMAVMRFKKRCGFYRDLEAEMHTLYVIDGNDVINKYGAADAGDAA